MNNINSVLAKGYLPKMFVGILVAVVLTAGATLTWARAGDQNLIFACVNNSSGTIKIVSAATQCAKNESLLKWSSGESTGSSQGGVFAFRGGSYANHEENCSALWGLNWDCSAEPYQDHAVPLPLDGHLVGLAVYPYVNTTQYNVAVTVIVNDAPTPISVEIPAGSTAVQVTDAQMAVNAGDLVWVKTSAFAGGERDELGFNGTLLYRVP
jgi:hypothetical protein